MGKCLSFQKLEHTLLRSTTFFLCKIAKTLLTILGCLRILLVLYVHVGESTRITYQCNSIFCKMELFFQNNQNKNWFYDPAHMEDRIVDYKYWEVPSTHWSELTTTRSDF